MSTSFDENDNGIKQEELILDINDKKSTNEFDRSECYPSTDPTELSRTEEIQISLDIEQNESRSLSLTLTSNREDEGEVGLIQSDVNVLSSNGKKPELKQDEGSVETQREEEFISFLVSPIEEEKPSDHASSTISSEDRINDNMDPLSLQNTSKRSSHDMSSADIEGNYSL